MIEINELENHKSLIYFPNKRLKVKKFVKISNSIFLYYSKLELKDFSKMSVILRNIKTRQEY